MEGLLEKEANLAQPADLSAIPASFLELFLLVETSDHLLGEQLDLIDRAL